eukprot:TRINITY_DN123955_c0_g1_i1.p1 TRINITY_DN123955_c0_g1~~TRINITY_DN123955_c0_g1_i1.p1  ORF type:complete len:1401 (+),score=339.02 TRINITY_DN123955_c0_g1_i1:82-4203(+)
MTACSMASGSESTQPLLDSQSPEPQRKDGFNLDPSIVKTSRLKRLWDDVKLPFELIVLTLVLYYVDLALDIQALCGFWAMSQFWFFGINLAAIVSTWGLTFVELLGFTKDFSLGDKQNLILGMAFPLQAHILVLVVFSIQQKKPHPVLVASKFAEAGIEAVTSSLIQLYSIIFCNEELDFATCQFEGNKRNLMAFSVLSSVITIAVAFTMFDLKEYGASGYPGSLASKWEISYVGLLLFRVMEVGSRLLTGGLFQLVTRPYGGWVLALVDFFFISLLIKKNRGQLRYVIPCMCCLVNPMFETNNVLSIPHFQYYTYRAAQVLVLTGVGYVFYPDSVQLLFTVDPIWKLAFLWLCMTCGWMLTVPLLRLNAVSMMEEEKYDWSEAAFTEVQLQVRDRVLEGKEEGPQRQQVVREWLVKFQDKIKEFLRELKKTKAAGLDESVRSDLTNKMVALAFNTPFFLPTGNDVSVADENNPGLVTSKELAKDLVIQKERRSSSMDATATEGEPQKKSFDVENIDEYLAELNEPVDLFSAFWATISLALREGQPSVVQSLVSVAAGPALFGRYVNFTLNSYLKISPEKYELADDLGKLQVAAAATGPVPVVEAKCKQGHALVDFAKSLGTDPPEETCDGDCAGELRRCTHICLACRPQETFCKPCVDKMRSAEMASMVGSGKRQTALAAYVKPDDDKEVQEVARLIAYVNDMMSVLGPSGAEKLFGCDKSECPIHSICDVLEKISETAANKDAHVVRSQPVCRAALEVLAPLLRGGRVVSLVSLKGTGKLELFESLFDTSVGWRNCVRYLAMPWFPAAVDVSISKRSIALPLLVKNLKNAYLYESGCPKPYRLSLAKRLAEYACAVPKLRSSECMAWIASLSELMEQFPAGEKQLAQELALVMAVLKQEDTAREESQQVDVSVPILPDAVTAAGAELPKQRAPLSTTLKKLLVAAEAAKLPADAAATSTTMAAVAAQGADPGVCADIKGAKRREMTNKAFEKSNADLRELLDLTHGLLIGDEGKQPSAEGLDPDMIALVVNMLFLWTFSEGFVKWLYEDNKLEMLGRILAVSAERALVNQDDVITCQTSLSQIIDLLKKLGADYRTLDGSASKGSSAEKSDPVAKSDAAEKADSAEKTDSAEAGDKQEKKATTARADKLSESAETLFKVVSDKIQPDEKRASLRELWLLCINKFDAGGSGEGNAANTFVLKQMEALEKEDLQPEDKDKLRKDIYLLVPQLTLDSSEPKMHEIGTKLLEMVMRDHDYKPKPDCEAFVERCMRVVDALSGEFLKRGGTLIRRFTTELREIGGKSGQEVAKRMLEKVAPRFSTMVDLEQIEFKLYQDWDRPVELGGKLEKNAMTSLADVVAMGKIMYCVFFTFW